MNKTECEALLQPLSNHARALYCIVLKPSANPTTALTAPLDYKSILSFINSKEKLFQRGRQINGLLKELMHVQLLELLDGQDINVSLNGCSLLLPALLPEQSMYSTLYENANVMHTKWDPNEQLLGELLALIGVIDTSWKQEDIGEFVAYWCGRPDIRLTEYQWTQRFAQQLKRKRTASGMMSVQRVGKQIIEPTSALEVDDNTKRLLEKYPNTNKISE